MKFLEFINKYFKKCDHEYEFVRNIYGDEINYHDGKRSVWKCKKCGKVKFEDKLKGDFVEELNTYYNDYYINYFENWLKSNHDKCEEIINKFISAAKEGKVGAEIEITFNNDKELWDKWITKTLNLNIYNVIPKKHLDAMLNTYIYEVRWADGNQKSII